MIAGAGAAALLAVPVAGATLADAAPAAPSVTRSAPVLARPAADRRSASDTYAPVLGVVQGFTGAAAESQVGGAAATFKKLATERAGRAAGTAQGSASAKAAAAQAHTQWGIMLPSSRSKGMSATHSVLTGSAAYTHGPDVVYAPTGQAGGGACMEMTTAYTSGGPYLWAWDWCGGRDRVGKEVPMGSSFLSTYTTKVNGRPAYSVVVQQTNASSNTWTSYLYNYKNRSWDTFYTSSGTFDLPDYPYGWNIFEIYSSVNPSTGKGYYCSSMNGQGFESTDLEVMVNGSWTPVTSGLSTVYPYPNVSSAMQCPDLKFTMVHANDDWFAGIGTVSAPSAAKR